MNVCALVAAAQARGVVFGRRPGQRTKSDRLAPKVLELVSAGHSYRQVGRLVNLSKNTVLDIVKRSRSENPLACYIFRFLRRPLILKFTNDKNKLKPA